MDRNAVIKRASELFREAYKYAEQCKWFDVDLEECAVTYMTGNTRYVWDLLCCGYKEALFKAERGICEKEKLRGGTKKYYKLFYKNGKLVMVEDYIDGSLSGYYLCYYTENVRVLMPFDTDKTNDWWHYCIVTWFNDRGVEKEVWIEDDDSQVIYSLYDHADGKIEYESANVLPHSDVKINSYERGVFYEAAKDYTVTESYSWLDDE